MGTTAPDFTLRDQFGQDVTLSEFRGNKAVALVFYPFAFSGVCTGELCGIRDRLDEFLTFDTEILAISCDPIYSLRAFSDADGLNFPLLSDFWPHGEVTRAYGVFDDDAGLPAPVVVRRRPRRDWCAGRCTTTSLRRVTSTSTCASCGRWPRPVRRTFENSGTMQTALGPSYKLVPVATAGDPRRQRSTYFRVNSSPMPSRRRPP